MYMDIKKCQREQPYYKWHFIETVDSTNDFLKRQVKEGRRETLRPTVLVAEKQTAGRGTKGRRWLDDPRACLKLSILLPLNKTLTNPGFLSPLVAVLCCRSLRNLGYRNVYLKWPNDIVRNGAKIAGILIEKLNRFGKPFLVIGIGINLIPSEVGKILGRNVGALLATMSETELPIIREEVLLGISSSLREIANLQQQCLQQANINEWSQYDELKGKVITLISPDKGAIEGEEEGIDKEGSLILKIDNRQEAFSIGEVSIKL